MAEAYEIIIELAHVGVIFALFFIGNMLGAFFVFLFWIYYHRKILKDIIFTRSGKTSEQRENEMYKAKWERYLGEYKKLENWLKTKDELKSENVDSKDLVSTLLVVRSNKIQSATLEYAFMAILIAFIAIVFAGASLYLIDPSFSIEGKIMWRNLILAVGIISILILVIGFPKAHRRL